MKTISKLMVSLLIAFGVSNCGNEKIDISRVNAMMENPSNLSEEDDDFLIGQLEAMVDKLSDMSESDQKDYLNTPEGDSLGMATFSLILYYGIRMENPSDIGAKELSPSQKAKLGAISEKITKGEVHFMSDFNE